MVNPMTASNTDAHTQFARQLADAISTQSLWPEFDFELDLEQAYALQHEITRAHSGSDIGGVKAGVTDPNIQKFLGLDSALIGSLYGPTRREIGSAIPHLESRMIEVEIALKIDAAGKPIALAPAIEFVRLKFARPTDMSAANLVISNLGTESYIVGEFVPWSDEFAHIDMVLSKGGEVVNQTDASAALDGPLGAAAWLRGEAETRGFSVDDETVYLAGSCGAAAPAEKGEFVAEYGPLGTIRFSIQ